MVCAHRASLTTCGEGEADIGDQRLKDALERVEAVFAGMATTVDADDLAQRIRIIGLRRELSVRLAEVNEAIEAVLLMTGDDGLTSDYRREISAFRRAVALHQTEWPAILISDDRAGYLASAKGLRRKREHFVQWVHDRLLPGR